MDMAHELTKVRPGRFGWTSKPDSKTPYKSIGLNGLISIAKDALAQGLAKCDGCLELNSVKSMDSEMVREFTEFKGFLLYIRGLRINRPKEDYTLMKQSLKHPALENRIGCICRICVAEPNPASRGVHSAEASDQEPPACKFVPGLCCRVT